MKRRHLHALFAPVITLAIATTFVACDKKTADQTAKPPTAPGEAPGAAEKIVEAVKEVVAPATPADLAKIRDAYGIAAQLPKDVEAFSVNLRLHDLWVKLSNSNWSAVLVNLPVLKQDPKFQQFLQQWNSPQAAKAKDILEALLGNEIAVAYPAGFTEKAMPWIDLFAEVQGLQMQRAIMTAMSGGRPPDSAKVLREAAPEIVPALVKCDFPPMLIALKAAKAKADIDGGIGMALQQLGMRLPPGVGIGKFKLADKYDFQNVTLNAAKLIEAMQEEKIRAQLADMLGDEAKAKQAVEALKKKTIEIAWGWVGDYLFVSFGADHAHLKFAGSDADSALAIPTVARRAAQFLDKKPLGLGYASAGMFEKLHGKLEFADAFKKISDELNGLLKPEQITAMQADVTRIEGKAQALYAAKFDPMVSVSFWEGGIRGEGFGGTRQTAFDTSKPLTFGSLLSKSVFFFADGRCNPANEGKYADLIEESAATLWSWYEKYGRTMVPENERQGAAMIEAMGVPMVKDFWAACRTMAKALGDETAFVLDLNGSVPKIPNLPPAFADGKVPRIAWVAELKNRAGVSEAWKGFDKIIKQVAAFAPGGAPIPAPQLKTEGDVEIHFIEPPIPTDDFLPHVAISKDRWILSSSPSLTKEISSKASATGGAPMGSEWRLQVPAVCDLAEAWLKAIDKNPAVFMRSSYDQREFAKLRPTFGDLVRLGRGIQSLEWRVFSEGSETRNSTYLKLEDIK